ncbi:protein transport protein Sec31A [Aplochiton taeniatus]
MKLKEINRTAIQSWSPAQLHPVYLATGTSAQQLDASFSTNASLEIFELDLVEPSLAMRSCGTFSSPHRYHKLVWGPHEIDSQDHPSGVLIAGGDNGDVIVYDPAKIISGDSDVIIAQSDKHTGPVRALDVNSFQTNLVASGGNESEIFIWDLNTFGSPMTPGPKTQPLEDISSVAWNRQVQHILASASPSGRVSVWDLRKNDLIIKVSDHSNRMHCSGLAWNPEVATQLVLGSEDDRMPVIQMWDLRFATSPLKILENHTRGVLAIAWSLADPDLLLSCGKDNRILCWNPNTAEVLYELPTSTQWCFDIQWCPRNPAVLSAASFDGHIGIYSIMGGSSQAQDQKQADQISTSFGTIDPFGTGQTLPLLQLPQPATTPVTVTPLKKPPKWICRPVGASFAFGGKLVSLDNVKTNLQQPTAHVVHISQVVTETAFLDRSNQLQATLRAGNFVEFCQTKIDAAQNEFEKTVWSYLKVTFEDDARGKYLELLGYKKEELASKIAVALEGGDAALPQQPCLTSDPVPAPVIAPEPNSSDQLDPLVPTPINQLIPESSLEPVPQPETLFEALPNLKTNVDQFDEDGLQPGSEFDHISLQPGSEFDKDALQPGSEFDQISLQPESEFDQIGPQPESEFNQIGLLAGSDFDQDGLQPGSEHNHKCNLQPATELDHLVETPAVGPPPLEADFDPTSSLNLQSELDLNLRVHTNILPVEEQCLFPPANLPPEAEFDLIAATNLQPAVEPESPLAPLRETASVLGIEGTATSEEEAVDTDIHSENTTDKTFSEEIFLEQGLSVTTEPETSCKEESPRAVCEVTTKAPALSTNGIHLSVSQDVDDLITQALLTGDFEGAVELCLYDNRMADSIILAIAGGPELLARTQKKYFTKRHSKITKLISAVVLKDWRDILHTCDLLNWKEALAAVMTYAQPEEFSSLCDLIGSRLEAAKEGQLQVQACLCYICAGNVEKLVECWTGPKGGTSPLSLLELIEKVVVLRQAVKQTQESAPSAVGVLLAEKMSQYSSLLASQGSLATAIAYLPENATQIAVQQLHDRLTRALDQPASAAVDQRQRGQVPQAQPHPPYTPDMTAMVSKSSPVTVEATVSLCASTQSQYYQPMRAASTVTSWSNQTPTALLSLPPQASDQQAEVASPKYGMQEPVTAAAPPASTTHPCMYTQQYQRKPLQHSSSSANTHPPIPPPYPSSAPAPSPGFKPQYMQPSTALNSLPSRPPFLPTASSSSFSFLPISSGESFQHGGQGSPVSYMPPPPPTGTSGGFIPDTTCFLEGPQNGWNDPPSLSGVPKKKKVLNNYTPPAPITAPIMVPLGVDPQGQPMASVPLQPMVQSQAGGQHSYLGIQQQPLSPPPMNPIMPKTSGEGAPGAPIGDIIQPMQSIPAEKISKKPIPDEHLVLKTTFEALIQKCLTAANDPQTKRKLDDANKRLEALYDKLREQTLSPAIVGGLLNMVRSIESRSYIESINIHTHIVNNSNFSETSAFMPVLKVVLTQANRLSV